MKKEQDDNFKLTIEARIKWLEEENLFWKKAHLTLQNQFINHIQKKVDVSNGETKQ